MLELNRSLPWPDPTLRIAVISARGAAGYGDFINQLFNTPSHLRFSVKLFPALLQGERTSASVIAALDAIAAESHQWDCVVIIRGGGATSDLVAFDDYDLANNVAQFPLPVIVGIGHERDVTVLDFVAAMRVKTPTAAAQWLISKGEEALEQLQFMGSEILRAAADTMAGARTRLAYFDGLLPLAPSTALERAASRLHRASAAVGAVGPACIAPARERLNGRLRMIETAASAAIERQLTRLRSASALADVLSPMATLRRGYTITRIDGHAVKSVASLSEGTRIETVLPDGTVYSEIIRK